jgi:C4-dicarboxylate-specific signal transduction histidine kinase
MNQRGRTDQIRRLCQTVDDLRVLVAASAAEIAISRETVEHVRRQRLKGAARPRESWQSPPVNALGPAANSIAHELNQPLTAIRANASAALRALGESHGDSALAIEALEDIITASERARILVEDFRTLVVGATLIAQSEPTTLDGDF